MGGHPALSVVFLLFFGRFVTVIWVVGVIAYKFLVVQPETES